jgi:hypothetical protein
VDPHIPQALRDKVRRRSGLIPIRLELFPHDVQWRAVANFEHSTLCAAFGLDPASFWFDLPRSALGVGTDRVGAGRIGSRRVDGYVMRGPKGSDPVGKMAVCWESERFRDRDPTDRSDFFRLGDAR